jgi:glycosyltransferase involved in cell wall biosynthesis
MSSQAGIEAVVIPAHNEARTIRAVAAGALQQVPLVLVVDDASTDGTADLLEGLPVVVLRNEQNRGKAASLLRGAHEAIERGASAIVTLDGDGQHSPEDIPSLLKAYRAMPGSIVIGARLHHRAKMPPSRYWANRFANFWIRLASWIFHRRHAVGFPRLPRTPLANRESRLESRPFIRVRERDPDRGARHGVFATCVPISVVYSARARASYFRPVVDIARITRMVAWRLLREGTLLRALNPLRFAARRRLVP